MEEKKEEIQEKLDIDFFMKEIESLKEKTEKLGRLDRLNKSEFIQNKVDNNSNRQIFEFTKQNSPKKVNMIKKSIEVEGKDIKLFKEPKFREDIAEVLNLPNMPAPLKNEEISTGELMEHYASTNRFIPGITPVTFERPPQLQEIKLSEEDKEKLKNFFELGKKEINKLPKEKVDYQAIKDHVQDKSAEIEQENILPENISKKPEKIRRKPKKVYFEYEEFLELVENFNELKNISSNETLTLKKLNHKKEDYEKVISRVNLDLEQSKKMLEKLKSLVSVQIE